MKFILPPVRCTMAMAGVSALAAMLVVSVAMIRNAIMPMTRGTFSIMPVSCTGSQMASPNITTVQLVTSEPTSARPTMPDGMPMNWPTMWDFWSLATFVRSVTVSGIEPQ